MNRYIVGQAVFFRVRLSDPATGDADDPASQDPVDDATITMTLYAPDQTNSVLALTHASLGVYTAVSTLTQEGIYEYATNATGAGAGAAKERVYVSPLP